MAGGQRPVDADLASGTAGGLRGWVQGWVGLQVRAPQPARALDALLRAGMRVRQARVRGGVLTLQLPLREVRRLRGALRGQRARVRITGRAGLPFIWARARRRPVLLAVAALGLLALYGMSGFVWFVQVQGTGQLASAQVLAAARRLGLAPGVWRAALDPLRVSRELPVLLPELAWAAVTLHGTLATIQVVERGRAPALEAALVPGDVVAREGGVVAAIHVLVGEARVQVGERVSPGQVLIAGQVLRPVAPDRRSPAAEVRPTPVHASGIVLIRRWQAAYAEMPLDVEVRVPTGRTYVRLALQLGARRLYLSGWRPVPFRAYRLQRDVRGPWRWRSLPFPVELITLRYVEVRRFVRRLSVQEARDAAAAEARALLLGRLPPRARILEERLRTVLLPARRVGVEVLLESEENVGVFRPVRATAAG